MSKISIIIPAYNVEQYLPRCLDSILSQTFNDFEVVVVDDGSSDRTGEICDEYAALDKRINVVHKQNEGVSIARNVGIEYAHGVWCCFVDSDDWIESKYLENFNIERNRDCQLIMQSFIIDNEKDFSSKKVVLPDATFCEPSSVVNFLENYPNVHNGFIWHRLFRLDIIKKGEIKFPLKISFAEDGWFFFDYMRHVSKSVCSSCIGYHYIIRKGSLTSKHHAYPFVIYKSLLEHYIASLLAFNVSDEFTESHIQMVKRYACRLASSWCIERILCCSEEYGDFIEELKNVNKQYGIYDVKGLRPYQRLQKFAVLRHSWWLQKKIFRISLWVKCCEDTINRKYLQGVQKKKALLLVKRKDVI